jgi:hypothetical protein
MRRVSGETGPWPLGFHRVQGPVRCVEKGSDGFGIARITGCADTHGEPRFFGIFRKQIANPLSYQCSGGWACFRQDQGKFIPAVASRRVHGPATVCNDLPQPAERPASHLMPKLIIDPLQAIEVQQK